MDVVIEIGRPPQNAPESSRFGIPPTIPVLPNCVAEEKPRDIIHTDSSHLREIYFDMPTIRRSFRTKFRRAGFTDQGGSGGPVSYAPRRPWRINFMQIVYGLLTNRGHAHGARAPRLSTGVALVKRTTVNVTNVTSTKINLFRVICPIVSSLSKREFRGKRETEVRKPTSSLKI